VSPPAIQEKLHVAVLREPDVFSWYWATVLATTARGAGYWINQTGVPVMGESRRGAEAKDTRTDQRSGRSTRANDPAPGTMEYHYEPLLGSHASHPDQQRAGPQHIICILHRVGPWQIGDGFPGGLVMTHACGRLLTH
jgi:hypothetical protein